MGNTSIGMKRRPVLRSGNLRSIIRDHIHSRIKPDNIKFLLALKIQEEEEGDLPASPGGVRLAGFFHSGTLSNYPHVEDRHADKQNQEA